VIQTMIRPAVVAALVTLAFCAAAPTPAATPVPPAKQIKSLKSQLAKERRTTAGLRLQLADRAVDLQAAQAALAAATGGTTDPLALVLAREPEGLWAAVQALYGAFPRLGPGVLCGFDANQNVSLGGAGLMLQSFTFTRWTGC
jgi:hypothetical protein